MTQSLLAFRRPAGDLAAAIRFEVERLLRSHVGASRAIGRGTLSRLVRENLDLHQLAQTTLDRRVREACAELLDRGLRLVASGDGLYLAETEEEIRDGDRALLANLMGAARRLASYRRTTAAELLRLLDLAGGGR